MKKYLLFLLTAALLTSCVSLRASDEIARPAPEPGPAETIRGEHAAAEAWEKKPGKTAEEDTPAPPLDSLVQTDPYAGVHITFLATGDNLIHPNIYGDAALRGTAEKPYDFLPMYEHITEAVQAVDYAFINQETLMAGEDYGYSGWPCFNAPQQLGLDMVEVGFDLIGMANNHMLDRGANGLSSTMDFWDTQPVMMLGAYRDAEDARRLRIIEQDGVKLAILSYTYGTNGIVLPADSPLVVPYIDDALLLSDLERAEAEADFSLVSIHWGVENVQTVSDEQQRLAQLCADNGADLIIGHHPHAVQPIVYVDAADGRQVLCVYSLGNLVSGMARPVNQVGGLFTFTIGSDGDGGLEVQDPLFTPTVFYYGMDWYNTKLYLMQDYTPEIAASHGVAISGYTLTPEQAQAFITQTIDAAFLPAWMQPEA